MTVYFQCCTLPSKLIRAMKIRIGGVPEHFNYPWHEAIKDGSFSNLGLEVEWQDVPGGTGAMNAMLREGSLDLAVVLTEGIVADIINGNPSLIVQKFIKSPLIWGIHSGHASEVHNESDFSKLRFAISRNGSGSHIMAMVEAKNRGVLLKPNQLVVCKNFDGAVDALNSNTADLLLWEKFTSKPTVDAGTLRRIGETVTPWPCFVIAARQELLVKNPDKVWNLLWMIRKISRHFMNNEKAEQIISEQYGLSLGDAYTWFNKTEWEQDVYISKKMLNNVINTLHDLNAITRKVDAEELCWNRSIVY
ncbi:MAG: sulfonate transport system substrate-binding protein [Bacteroidia bacterium]